MAPSMLEQLLAEIITQEALYFEIKESGSIIELVPTDSEYRNITLKFTQRASNIFLTLDTGVLNTHWQEIDLAKALLTRNTKLFHIGWALSDHWEIKSYLIPLDKTMILVVIKAALAEFRHFINCLTLTNQFLYQNMV